MSPTVSASAMAVLLLVTPVRADTLLPPLAFTGGFSELNCTRCHGGSANPAGGGVTINPPAAYAPNNTYPLQVTISDASGPQWGFELSARFTNGSQAGSLAVRPGDSNTTVRTASSGGFSVQYASHLNAPIQAGAGFTFTVNWTAPPDASGGEVVFNAAGMAANNDKKVEGDRTYTTMVRSAGGPPKINSGGVVSAASFVPAPGNLIAPGMLISIFGAGLTSGGPYSAAGFVFPLPATLGPTTVTIGGLQVPLLYVSSTQINAQAPFEIGESGSKPCVITVNSLSSAQEPVFLASAAPGIFTVLHTNYSVVDTSKPAAPGEIILIFCTGLGATTPPASTGLAASRQERVVAPVSVTIGGKSAAVLFAGLVQGLAGLYQINAIVPMVAGSSEVLVMAGTASSPSGVMIPILP